MIASSPEFHIKIWNLLKEIFHHSAKEVQTYLSIITSYLNKGCQRAFFSVVSKYYDREKKKKKKKKAWISFSSDGGVTYTQKCVIGSLL